MTIQSFAAAAMSIAFATIAYGQPAGKSRAEIQAERLKVPAVDKAAMCREETVSVGAPKYPGAALRSKTEGWALLSFDLDGSGSAVNIAPVESLPSGVFEQAAIDQLKRSRFLPGAKKTGCRHIVTYALE